MIKLTDIIRKTFECQLYGCVSLWGTRLEQAVAFLFCVAEGSFGELKSLGVI